MEREMIENNLFPYDQERLSGSRVGVIYMIYKAFS